MRLMIEYSQSPEAETLRERKGDKPLVKLPEEYIHSSALFYINRAEANIKLSHLGEMKDVNLTLDEIND